MGQTTKHQWKCDGCDDIAKHEDSWLPEGWTRFELSTITGAYHGEHEFTLCNPCGMVLFRNRRTGTTWFHKLAKCMGVRAV